MLRNQQDEASGASSDEGVEAIVQGLLQDEAETRFSGRTEEAVRFYNHASGKLVGFSEHLEAWLSSVSNKAKTVDEKRSWIKRFAAKHAYVQDVTRKLVQAWINSLAKDDGLSPDSIHKGLSALRGYWKYLISLEVAAEDSLPFERVTVPKINPKLARQEFTPAEVVRLHQEAKARGDDQLADLIQLGMWTGARIEELCALKVADVHADWFLVRDAKTAAGVRKVPIHSKLKPTIKRLKKASKDGYLLSDLPTSKYGDRSPAISKAFGRLRTALEFGPSHVFHSIRRTVATLFKQVAPEAEALAAEIMGHKVRTMTYGLYAGGSPIAVLSKVVEKLSYPAPKQKRPHSPSRSGK